MKRNESTLEHFPSSLKRFKSKKKKIKQSDYKISIENLPPEPLSESETNTLLSIMCNNPGVTFTPREIKKTTFSGTPQRWQVLGFSSNEHYIGFCQFNGVRYEDA